MFFFCFFCFFLRVFILIYPLYATSKKKSVEIISIGGHRGQSFDKSAPSIVNLLLTSTVNQALTLCSPTSFLCSASTRDSRFPYKKTISSVGVKRLHPLIRNLVAEWDQRLMLICTPLIFIDEVAAKKSAEREIILNMIDTGLMIIAVIVPGLHAQYTRRFQVTLTNEN